MHENVESPEKINKNNSIKTRILDFIKTKPIFRDKKFYIIGSVILIIIIILLFSLSSSSPTNIPTYEVKKGKFLVAITESGEIRAKNSISILAPRVRGNLKITFIVPEGSYVKAGDTVLKFDPTEALNNLREAQARLEVVLSDKERTIANHKSQKLRSENDLKNAELSLQLSKLSLEQMKFEAQIKQQETKLQVERNELNLLRARQDLESQKVIHHSEINKANIDVQQRTADLDKAKKDFEQLTITAPTEGLVVYENNWSTGRKIQIGDAPWPGMTIITLPDLSLMQSITNVNEVDVSNVRKNQSVLVRLDAFPDSIFQGTISKVASLGRTKEGSVGIKVFEIEVDLKSQSEILKPGMTTSNKIIVNEIPNVIYVPQEAVFEKFDKKIVYVKNGSSFDEKSVDVGEKSDNFIVIKSGLAVGEIIALRDPTVDIEKEKISDEAAPEKKQEKTVKPKGKGRRQ